MSLAARLSVGADVLVEACYLQKRCIVCKASNKAEPVFFQC